MGRSLGHGDFEPFPTSPDGRDLILGAKSGIEYGLEILEAAGWGPDSIQALRDLPITREKDGSEIANGTIVYLRGYYSPGDGAGGPPRLWDGGHPPGFYTDNGGSIIVPSLGNGSGAWIWNWKGWVDFRWFGAVGDWNGTTGTDDTAAFVSALAAGLGHYYLSKGRYKITQSLKGISTASNPLWIAGQSKYGSVIDFSPPSYSALNDTGLWFGNSTEDMPSSLYECVGLRLENFGVYVGINARVGVRLREIDKCFISNLFVGAKDSGTVTNCISLYVDGAINTVYDHVDLDLKAGYGTSSPNILNLSLSNSMKLDRSAGSGDGAGVTTQTFRDCYIHEAGILAKLTSVTNVSFDGTIFEAGNDGIYLYDSWMPIFRGCYWEAINTYPIRCLGTDQRVVSNVIVEGGYYNANAKSGYNGDSFIYGENTGKIKVSGLQVTGTVAIGKLVTLSGSYNNNVQIDAKLYNPNGTSQGLTTDSLTDPFSTTSGGYHVSVAYAGHGRKVGDTVGFSGFTSPLNDLPVNQPFWKVTSVTDVDNFVCEPIITGGTYVASGTASGLGGSGTITMFSGDDWVNAEIDQADHVKLIDCVEEDIILQSAFATAQSGTLLGFQGDDGTNWIPILRWSYLMRANQYTNVIQTVDHTNYCQVYLNLPTGYDSGLIIATCLDIPTGSFAGPVLPIGLKVPPGSTLGVRFTETGGVGSVNYTKSNGIRISMSEAPDNG